jgi:hypothetical protein
MQAFLSSFHARSKTCTTLEHFDAYGTSPMQGQKVLYNFASLVAVAGAFATVIDGVASLKHGQPSK